MVAAVKSTNLEVLRKLQEGYKNFGMISVMPSLTTIPHGKGWNTTTIKITSRLGVQIMDEDHSHGIAASPDGKGTTSTPNKRKKRTKSPTAHRKACTLCDTLADVLVRCQIDRSGTWHFVCPGKCWKRVSGGVIDGDLAHQFYKYGGMWKNKHAGVSAKKPKAKKAK